MSPVFFSSVPFRPEFADVNHGIIVINVIYLLY